MNREDLTKRATKRAMSRYGEQLSETLFDDLIDDGLIPKGERRGNEGKHPIYEFGRASYRRALQILRFRSKGIIDHDAIRVQLFVKGYSLPVWDVREGLRKEYIAFSKSVLSQIRSRYADNWRSVPPKHEQAFMRQAGSLHSSFEQAGFGLSAAQLIDIVRSAKQKPLGTLRTMPREGFKRQLHRRPALQEMPAPLLESALSGLLMFGDAESSSKEIDDVSRLIMSANDDAYLCARRLYRITVQSRFDLFWRVVHASGTAET